MSNHGGSYMLREVFGMLNEAGVWEHMPREKTQQLIVDVVNFARNQHDCNPGEILEDHEVFGICYVCLKPAEPLQDGICLACEADDDDEFEEE
jgi:hypothetical protein